MSLASLSPGDVFADFFEVVRRLKAGGMGAVYVVRHRETGKRLALKVMHPDIVADPEARARFKQEAQIASRIDAPKHIVDVQHAGIDASTGMPFIVMELLVGEELGELLKKRGRLPAAEVLDILRQTAKALDRAHDKGVVHRDLKPENLFLMLREDEPATVKILDFGIAKIMESASQGSTFLGGTPTFMAPEQTTKGAKITPATDVWALGLIAFNLLVGRSYWGTSSLPELLRAILVDAPAVPSTRAAEHGVTLGPAFDTWLLTCLRRDPHQRFQRASGAVSALADALTADEHAAPENATVAASPLLVDRNDEPSAGDSRAAAIATEIATSPADGSPHATIAAPPLGHAAPVGLGAPGSAGAGSSRGSTSPRLLLGGALAVGVVGAAITLGVIDREPEATPTSARTANGAASSSAPSAQPSAAPGAPQEVDPNPFVRAGSVRAQTHEVTRAEYARYLASIDSATRTNSVPLQAWSASDPQLPVTWVTFEQASGYCASIGARLPTNEEWTSLFDGAPRWETIWRRRAEGLQLGARAKVSAVGTAAGDVLPSGLRDLGGNVQEWTSTVTDGLARVRGGAAGMAESDARKAIEEGLAKFTMAGAGSGAKPEAVAGASVGFRCVKPL